MHYSVEFSKCWSLGEADGACDLAGGGWSWRTAGFSAEGLALCKPSSTESGVILLKSCQNWVLNQTGFSREKKKILYNPELFTAWAFPARRVESRGLKNKPKQNQQAVAPREHPSVSACVVSGALPAGPGGGAPRPAGAERPRAPGSAGGPSARRGLCRSGGAFCGGVWMRVRSLRARGWLVATADRRRGRAAAGAVRGYGAQLLLERNIRGCRSLWDVEGGGVYLGLVSNSYGLQSSRVGKGQKGTFRIPTPGGFSWAELCAALKAKHSSGLGD